MRVFNFAAGPATLPLEVLQQCRDELVDWRGSGMSVMEISHRSKAFIGVAQEAENLLRELLGVPSNYKVLFLQGGATGQFSAIPLNLTTADSTVDYINTGAWSKKAIGEAKRLTKVNVAADEAASSYCSAPAQSALKLTPGAAYVHYTPNETIGGVEFGYVPETNGVPLVADMSSTILSRPIDVSKFGLIYAGAQKNIGPSGLCVVIVRDENPDRHPSLPSRFGQNLSLISKQIISKQFISKTPPRGFATPAEQLLRWHRGWRREIPCCRPSAALSPAFL